MKQTNITLSIALAAVFSASTAFAEAEVTGKIVHESAKFTTSGTTIGAAAAQNKDYFKQETSARIFIDGDAEDLQDGATYHVELQAFKDGKAGANFDGNEADTQRDALREAYVDGTVNDWSIRAGKQQVVWGTADGMKLLDAINPTDFSEMAQNQMEDSRIPVWMINAETTNEDGSEFQVVVSQPKSNFIAGLSTIEDNSTRSRTVTRGAGSFGTRLTAGSRTTSAVDQGHAFIMNGVDSISGKSNGIINIVPELGEVADTFAAGGSAFTGSYGAGFHLENWSYATVEEFVNNTGGGASFGGFCPGYNKRGTSTAMASGGSAYCLQEIAYDTNGDQTNLLSGMTDQSGSGDWDQTTPDTVFEYMPDATFKTFATFAGAKTKYVRDGADNSANASLRYKNSANNGVNYSLNYMRTADANPHLELEWQNESGQKLTVTESVDASANTTGYRSIVLSGGGLTYGSVGGSNIGSYVITNPVTLVLKEKNALIHNLGGSFDTAIETSEFGPVVLRGEALYQKDVMTPIVDKAKMSIGNITEAFTSQKGNRFKYVLGADITALTNMMVSVQFIQDRNLNYVDTTTTLANAGIGGSTAMDTDVVGARYTADMPAMSMQNQYLKAEENKEFYSLFLSKPFGASGEHRWNNIFMFEENGGKWNRLDAEFSIDDDTQATVEYNKYWGDANTQFGQLEASSNIQVGVKYSF